MAQDYLHNRPSPTERGGFTRQELALAPMPCYFGSKDWTAHCPKNVSSAGSSWAPNPHTVLYRANIFFIYLVSIVGFIQQMRAALCAVVNSMNIDARERPARYDRTPLQAKYPIDAMCPSEE
ncbi:hypothetical protein BDV37DRAFT_280910 [Aspergillus pseudonomiae]|uniref:Uncharacterized protein n=1 Tax=Aspergillus pseudonomiae TaxID=1506151 RepID=A0A5N7DIZ8_9EURO|nr:uncharacterized protein BDV37DRAFT_280910 [Aspergillus pseudonomiae]KAE8406314.1 hypothetical protein BDV37DRAFT_280910 [Aspergillus pseudonomiae]